MSRDKDRDSGRTAPVRARSVREQQTSDDAFWERSNDNRAGVAEAHRRFGGLDVPATLAGMVAALGTLVVLSGIAAGAGTIGYQSGLDDTDDLSLGGFIAGMVVLFLAFLVGGWVAGRMARYDGGRNGLVSALWFVLLVAGLAALGAWAGDRYEDEFTDLDLPRWFEDNARTTTAVITGLVAVVVALLAGFLGGRRGGATTARPTRSSPAREASPSSERYRPGPRPSPSARRRPVTRSATTTADRAPPPSIPTGRRPGRWWRGPRRVQHPRRPVRRRCIRGSSSCRRSMGARRTARAGTHRSPYGRT